MYDRDLVLPALRKIAFAIDRILSNADKVNTPDDYLSSPSGMEHLESTCMLLIAIGEVVKNIDKITAKKLWVNYPEINWQGVTGMRDVIAHHYFDIDAGVVFDVVKNELPKLKIIIQKMIADLDLH
ncbi:MAG: DUF86 domain-containing protein [Bacteroidales bacterium]